MGKEKEAEFYTGKGYMEKAIKRYWPIYQETFMAVKEARCGRVIEFGCGVGVLAKMLYDEGFTNYLGIDFSSDMIRLAKSRAPQQCFLQLDLRESIKGFCTGSPCFICLETLEHIKNDLQVLDNIPSGATVIFSVPTYNFKAHVRYFKTKEEVIDRYSISIEIKECKLISKIWVCKGVKK